MGRRNRKDNCGRFELRSESCGIGTHVIRRITMREGDSLCAQGKAKLMFDEVDQCYWYKLTGAPAKSGDQSGDIARTSCTVLSRAETEAAVGFFGQSETEGLTNTERKLLDSLNRETHDFVERARVKLDSFRPRRSEAAA